MSLASAVDPHVEPENYLTHEKTVRSWLLTKDHKRIGVMYFGVIIVSLLLGGVFALGVRLQLWNPDGGLVSNDGYNR